MTNIYEIAPDVFRLSTFIPEAGIQFNQFLVRDDEPLLYHTGMAGLFPAVYEAVAQLIDPATLRWISFSHFEADESGALNKWLEAAPQSQAAANIVGVAINLGDFAIRPPRPLMNGEILETGRRRYRFLQTPHVPHGWDAGMLYEETGRVLFTSDLFHQNGELEPLTSNSLIDRARQTLLDYQPGPFADYQPYTRRTGAILDSLANLAPGTLATMHGSSFSGDGGAELLKLKEMMHDTAQEFYPDPVLTISN
jgi:flavorubredoxin